MVHISKNFTKFALAGVAAFGAMTAANDVGAQATTAHPIQFELGKCYEKNAAFDAMEIQGQAPLIYALRSIPSQPKNTFTTNADLSSGMQFEETPTQLCIKAKYRNIRLNNTDTPIPNFVPIAPANSEFNQWLQSERERADIKVIFAAVALAEDANGVERPAAKIVITQGRGDQNVTNRGTIIMGLNDGRAARLANVNNITPDDNFKALADYQSRSSIVLASNQQPK